MNDVVRRPEAECRWFAAWRFRRAFPCAQSGAGMGGREVRQAIAAFRGTFGVVLLVAPGVAASVRGARSPGRYAGVECGSSGPQHLTWRDGTTGAGAGGGSLPRHCSVLRRGSRRFHRCRHGFLDLEEGSASGSISIGGGCSMTSAAGGASARAAGVSFLTSLVGAAGFGGAGAAGAGISTMLRRHSGRRSFDDRFRSRELPARLRQRELPEWAARRASRL